MGEREGHTKAIALIKEYLSGKRSIGLPTASSTGVVMGECITAAVAEGKVAQVETPRFFEIVEVLKRELCLSGNMKDVVEQAAEALGLSTKGKNLHSIAEECAQQVGIRF